jgi:muramoyltetrapeptide carboxypeptidase
MMTGKMKMPPYLKSGDKVMIVSPASKIDKSLLAGAKKRLEEWGLKVKIAKHADGANGKYAGSIKQRLADLQAAMDDPEVRAILCSRGGYGCVHLLDDLDFTAFRKSPKWLIGFSDISALHCAVQMNGVASLHSPMARHLTIESADDICTQYMHDILFGNLPTYTCKSDKLNHRGTARGILRGGNMAVTYGLRGSRFEIPAERTILFLEDVGERPHSIERMMYNLKISGVLDRISGLIIGQFTEYNEDLSLGKPLYEALADILKGYDYPVCFGFPVGHVTDNRPLICGSEVELSVTSRSVGLSFIC